MPAKNIIKIFVENGFYHIYNRGVEKRTIFQDKKDYNVFLYYLKLYLSPPELSQDIREKLKFANISRFRPLNNFYQNITLLAYCLRFNHFHLLIRQKNPTSIEKFMRSLATKYAQYFNKRYQRVGHLFQGTYKAVLIKTDKQLLHLSRYIHLNPLSNKAYPLNKKHNFLLNSYSSYADYLGRRKTSWLQPEQILSFFKSRCQKDRQDLLSYQSFVEKYSLNTKEPKIISSLTLE